MLPATSLYVLANVTTLVVSSRSAVGVNVAVQVTPPSVEATIVNVPPAMARSALLKLLTASLKVRVTNDVSPAFSAVSAKTIVGVIGALRSIT